VVVLKIHSQGAAADGSMGGGGGGGGGDASRKEGRTPGTAGGGRRPLVNVAGAIAVALRQLGVRMDILVASSAV